MVSLFIATLTQVLLFRPMIPERITHHSQFFLLQKAGLGVRLPNEEKLTVFIGGCPLHHLTGVLRCDHQTSLY